SAPPAGSAASPPPVDRPPRSVAPPGHADHLPDHRPDPDPPAGRTPRRGQPRTAPDPRADPRGSRRDRGRVPSPARPARRARAAADRPVEGRRVHRRGDRGPAGLCAAHRRAKGPPHPATVETRAAGPRPMSPDRPTEHEQATPEEAAYVGAVADRLG